MTNPTDPNERARELKPCPFCGSQPESWHSGESSCGDYRRIAHVGCRNRECFKPTASVAGPWKYHKPDDPESIEQGEAQAVAAWNRRALSHAAAVEYDREEIARMLEHARAKIVHEWSVEFFETTIKQLRAADNADAAGVRTVSRPAPAAVAGCNCGAAPSGDDDQRRHSADCTVYDKPAAVAGGEWYTSDHSSHCLDFDADPKRQLSILLKADGTVAGAVTIDGQSENGLGVEWLTGAIQRWAAQPAAGDAIHAALCFLGELESVGNTKAAEIARGLRVAATQRPGAGDVDGTHTATPCHWIEDTDSGAWDTACGQKHQFTTGDATDNGHSFCPYCGGRLFSQPASGEAGQ